MIHGGVDGYSRIPVYLHCCNNNRADTVLCFSFSGKQSLSTAYHLVFVWTKEGENVDVAMYLLEHPLRGQGRSSVIVGKRVHNQRIERMWRDVYEGITDFYHSLF